MEQMQRNTQQILNYIKVANTYFKYRNIYFFLKNYAFNKMLNVKMKAEDEKSLKRQMDNFIHELGKSGWDMKMMSKVEYEKFLEFYYDQVINDAMELSTIYICKDLLEIMSSFGKYDELSMHRFDYFNKKINKCIANGGGAMGVISTTVININEITTNEHNDTKPINNINDGKGISDHKAIDYNKGTIAVSKKQDIPLKDLNQDISKLLIHNANNYQPTLIDKSFKFPLETQPQSNALKQKMIEHLTKLTTELDLNHIEESKNHIEAVIYYLRNSLSSAIKPNQMINHK